MSFSNKLSFAIQEPVSFDLMTTCTQTMNWWIVRIQLRFVPIMIA